MKLVYHVAGNGNFGDDLNPWLWENLLPGLLNDNSDVLLLGLGTILEPWFAQSLTSGAPKIVCGAGAGREYPFLELDETWRILGVRGPLTARYLNLESSKVLTDPAMCLRDFYKPPRANKTDVGFMPHCTSASVWDWEAECNQCGLVYLDPHGDCLDTLRQISGLKSLITEAMHGAIVADALRIPWRGVRINPHNYTGKWDDWASSVRLPAHLLSLPNPERWRLNSTSSRLKLRFQGLSGGGPAGLARAARGWLTHLLKEDRWFLSSDQALESAIDRFYEALDPIKRGIY